MPEKTVTFEGKSVTVQRANGYVGLQRDLLKVRAMDENHADPDEVRRIYRLAIYPDLVPPVAQHSGFGHWPPTLDELMALDEEFLGEWADAVYALNPHWRQQSSPETDEKKALS